eukprot:scaffold3.g6306.t1
MGGAEAPASQAGPPAVARLLPPSPFSFTYRRGSSAAENCVPGAASSGDRDDAPPLGEQTGSSRTPLACSTEQWRQPAPPADAAAPRPGSAASQRMPLSDAGSQASMTLDAVLQSMALPGGGGPSEVRTLLPGAEAVLRRHGIDTPASISECDELPVITAPRGLCLHEAISAASALGWEGGPAPGGSVAPRPTSQASTPCSSSATATLQGATLPPPAGPAVTASGESITFAAQQQQPSRQDMRGLFGRQPQQPASSAAGQEPAPEQQLMEGVGVVPDHEAPTTGGEAGSQGQLAVAASWGGFVGFVHSLAAPSAEDAVALQQQQQDEGGAQLPGIRGFRRFWSADGAAPDAQAGAAGATPLDVTVQARAAVRMWPMLSPFVPRVLREDLCSPHPRFGAPAAALEPAGSAAAAEAAAASSAQALSRAMQPRVEQREAAVMIADVTGFTALTEALSKRGSAGVELLTRAMNRYFTQVIDLLLLYGGDVVKFAGDSMIVAFLPSAEEAEGHEDGGLQPATLRALTCAAELGARFGAMRMLPSGEVVMVPAQERAALARAEAEAQACSGNSLQAVAGMLAATPGRLAQPVGAVAGPVLHGTVDTVAAVVDAGSRVVDGVAYAGSHVVGGVASVAAWAGRAAISSANSGPRSADADVNEFDSTGATAFSGSNVLQRAHSASDVGSVREEGPPAAAPAVGGGRRARTPLRHASSMLARPRRVRPTRSLPQDLELDEPGLREADLHQQVVDSLVQMTQRDRDRRPPPLAPRGPASEGASRVSSPLSGQGPPPAGRFASGRPPLRAPTAPPALGETLRRYAAATSPTRTSWLACGMASDLDAVSPCVARDSVDSQTSPASRSFSSRLGAAAEQEQEGQPAAAAGPQAGDTQTAGEVAGEQSVLEAAQPPLESAFEGRASQEWGDSLSPGTQGGGTGGGAKQQQGDGRLLRPRMGDRLLNAISRAANKMRRSKSMARSSVLSASSRASSSLSVGSAIAPIASVASLHALVGQVGARTHSGSRRRPSRASSPPPTSARWRKRSSLGVAPVEAAPSAVGLGRPATPEEGEEAAMERVVLSLKVLLAAGTACLFHVGGGGQEAASDPAGVPQWEFFIGDAPHAAPPGADLPTAASGAEGGAIGESGAAPARRQPMQQLAAIEGLGISGQTVLSAEASALVGGACLLRAMDGGSAALVQLLAPSPLPERTRSPPGEEPLSAAQRASQESAAEAAALAALPERPRAAALQVLRMHALENVRARVEAGHIDYVNEARTCTVLFLGFPFLSEPRPGPDPAACAHRTAGAAPEAGAGEEAESVQRCMEVVQKRMRQYNGSLFRCDEKGFLAICAFGLPGRSHEHNAARGLQAALAIVEGTQRRGGRACCGVTTGQLFCAIVGSQRRAEYTMFGDAINLSARLMMAAKRAGAAGAAGVGGLVYCDAATQRHAQGRAEFVVLEPMRLKGKQEPVEVFEARPPLGGVSPLAPGLLAAPAPRGGEAPPAPSAGAHGGGPRAWAPPPAVAAAPAAAPPPGRDLLALGLGDRLLSTAPSRPCELRLTVSMIGREAELAALRARVDDLVERRVGGVVLVEGEPGMGKSRLVAELQASCLGGGEPRPHLYVGVGRAERRSQALYPWRRVLRSIFLHDAAAGQLYCSRAAEPQRAHVVVTELGRRLSEAAPEYGAWRAALADAFDLPLAWFPAAVPPAQLPGLEEQGGAGAGAAGLGSGRGLAPRVSFAEPEAMEVAASGALVSASEGPRESGASVLREEDEAFLSAEDRARSFAMRMRRSVSHNQMSGDQSSSPTRAAVQQWSSPRRPQSPDSNPSSPTSSAPSSVADTSLVSPASSFSSPAARSLLGPALSPQQSGGEWAMMRTATAAQGALALQPGLRPVAVSSHLQAKRVQELAVAVLRCFADAYGPLVLALEDLHYWDTASWRLLCTAADELADRLLLVATYRPNFGRLAAPMGATAGKEVLAHRVQACFRQLAAHPAALRLALRPLDVEQTRSLLSLTLAGAEVPTEVAELVWEKSSGLPDYCEQLALYLRSHVAGQAPSAEPSDIRALERSALEFIRNTVSLHSTIADRLDRLRPEEQLVLKAAHPQQPRREAVEACLAGLEAARFMRQEDSQEASAWQFCQARGAGPRCSAVLARDVVYDMVPLGQRREWHARLAAAMEGWARPAGQGGEGDGQGPDHLPPATIAFHWTQSCRRTEATQWHRTLRAIEWWQRAAVAALDAGEHAEALALLGRAQGLAEQLAAYSGGREEPPAAGEEPVGAEHVRASPSRAGGAPLPLVPRLLRVHWERCMAAMCLTAELSAESLGQAQMHCLEGLALLNAPMPWSPAFISAQRWRHLRPGRLLRACFGRTCAGGPPPGGAGGPRQPEPLQLSPASLTLLCVLGTAVVGSPWEPSSTLASSTASAFAAGNSLAGGSGAAPRHGGALAFQRRSGGSAQELQPSPFAPGALAAAEAAETLGASAWSFPARATQQASEDGGSLAPAAPPRGAARRSATTGGEHRQREAAQQHAGARRRLQSAPTERGPAGWEVHHLGAAGHRAQLPAAPAARPTAPDGAPPRRTAAEALPGLAPHVGGSTAEDVGLGAAALYDGRALAAAGFAGDARYSAAEKAEAAAILGLLCSALLVPQQLDREGLRYVVWMGEHLQGGRVHEGSPFWPTQQACERALQRRRRGPPAGDAAAGQALASEQPVGGGRLQTMSMKEPLRSKQ